MADNTNIPWADASWNPVTGCTPISEACQHCYAKRMANRLKGRFGYPKDEPFRPTFHPDRLGQPLKWKKPKRIFVCSMADLFHEKIKEKDRGRVFGHIAAAYWHTFLILTKRTGNMEEFSHAITHYPQGDESKRPVSGWPPNAMAGATVELQKYDYRIRELLQIPAAVKFLSLEPLLGPIDFKISIDGVDWYNALTGRGVNYSTNLGIPRPFVLESKINWVIIGGLSLPGGKVVPPKREWVDSIVEQCSDAGVPIFLKPNAQYPIERKEFPK